MIRDKLLRVVVSGIIPLIILFGVYVQIHGEISPGGGFQSGVLLAASFIIFSIAFGFKRIFTLLQPALLVRLAAAGALLYLGTGILPLLKSGIFLQHSRIMKNVPIFSQELGIFLLELGVGLAVFSSILAIYMCFSLLLQKRISGKDK